MFFTLSKLLAFLLVPLNWLIFLLVCAWFWRKKSVSRILNSTAFILFIFFSNPYLNGLVRSNMEFPETKIGAEEHVKYAIVLSGYASVGSGGELDMGKSADRFTEALNLLHNGIVDTLILSGGSGLPDHPELLESEVVRQHYSKLFHGAVIVESNSRNTRESAECVKEMLMARSETERVMLLTSALHMKRALQIFEKEGIHVLPYAVDQKVVRKTGIQDILPSARTLADWTELLHELVGRIVYRML